MVNGISMNRRSVRVLLVEDDTIDAELARWALAANLDPLFAVESAQTLSEAIEHLRNKAFDVVLLDLDLPDSPRFNTLARLRDVGGQDIPIVVLTDQVDEQSALELLNGGAQDCIDKNDLTPILLTRSILFALLRQPLTVRHQKALALSEASNRRLSRLCTTAQQFVENVSHEFRTPLTVIREFTSIIRDGLDGPVTARQEEHLNKVLHRTDDLAAMVDDILDISRFEAGLLGVWRRKCRVQDLIENVLGLLKGRAGLKSIALTANVPRDLPEVFCDEDKASRVLLNLIVNAIKFAPEGGRVDIWARQGDDVSDVTIGVADNGPGICKENLDMIFERFQQGSQAPSSCTKGFGLGLNIARELVGLNLGQFNIDTRQKVGSTFSFTLPRFDARVVLERLLDRQMFIAPSKADVSLFTIDVDKRCLAVAVVDEFLQRSFSANNLVMPRGSESWIAAAACTESECEELIRRLKAEWTSYARHSPEATLPLLRIAYRGTWSLADQREDAIDAFAELSKNRDESPERSTMIADVREMSQPSSQDQQKSLKSGTNFYVRKPYDVVEAMSAIESSF